MVIAVAFAVKAASAAPALLVQLGLDAAALSAIVTAVTLACKFRPFRWVLNTLVGAPLNRWRTAPARDVAAEMKTETAKIAASLAAELSKELTGAAASRERLEVMAADTLHLVHYHLGPNSDTTPVVERIAAIEAKVAGS